MQTQGLPAHAGAEGPGAAPPTRRPSGRAVVLATGVLGAVLLGVGLQAPPGSGTFYAATVALAAVWVAGSLVAAGRDTFGDLRPDRVPRDVLWGVTVGAALLVLFLVGAGLVARVEFLAEPVERLLANARWGSLPVVTAITVLNGVTEEFYFRGALDQAVGGGPMRRTLLTAAGYTLVTAASGIALLCLAGLTLGLATGWLRQRTGTLVAPTAAHLTWSVGMLYTLQPALDFWS